MPKITSVEPQVKKLMERIYRLWNIRPRSEKEVRDYLKRFSVSSFIIDTIVERLKQLKLLSDEEFAKAWVESRSKKRGMQIIKKELFQKGISKEIIEAAINYQLSSPSGTHRQEEVAEGLLQKRLPRWRSLPLLKQKQKAYQFLLSRGFNCDLVKAIVEKLTKID